MLSAVVASLGDQPQDVLRGAAEEVLAVLKVSFRQDSLFYWKPVYNIKTTQPFLEPNSFLRLCLNMYV